MSPHSEELPFGEAPDPVLGTALRDALEGRAPEAFVARLQEALLARREDSVDVLARWAPRGMVAAAVAAIALWGVLQASRPGAEAGAEAGSALVHMEVTPGQAEGEVLVISLMEDR